MPKTASLFISYSGAAGSNLQKPIKMSSSRSPPEGTGDPHRDPYFDTEEDEENEDDEPDYHDAEDAEDDEEQDEDDMNHDLFEEDDDFHGRPLKIL